MTVLPESLNLQRLMALILLVFSLLHQVVDALETAGTIHLPESHAQVAADAWPDEVQPPECANDDHSGCDHCHGHTHIFISINGTKPAMPFSSVIPHSREPFAQSALVLPDQRPPIL